MNTNRSGNNSARRECARNALRAYGRERNDPVDYVESATRDDACFIELAGDLLADMLLLGAHLHVRVTPLLNQALLHYDAERLIESLDNSGLDPDPSMNSPIVRRVMLTATAEDD